MNKLKRFFTVLVVLSAAAVACTEKPNPLRDAIGEYAFKGQEGTFQLDRIEKIDSTTMRTEFEHRQNVFELKLREETKLYEDYTRQGMRNNAARHQEAIQRTNAALKGLDSLRTSLEDRMDEIAYYDYVFSGRMETVAGATEFKDAYVSLTPGLEVVSMTAAKKDLHKAGGRSIPGYMQMIESIK